MDSKRVAAFIAMKRREMGLTQAQVAEKLGVSYQAVSKWERGTVPNVEIVVELAKLLHVSVDTLLAGGESWFSYEKAGIDLERLRAFKGEAAAYCTTGRLRVVDVPGFTPPLLDIHFPDMQEPVLVMNTNTIGAKCKLAAKYGYLEVVGRDIVNDLAANICTAGARPLAFLDSIVGGGMDRELFASLLKGIEQGCEENESAFIGGCTNIQPQTMLPRDYVLTGSLVGVVEKSQILDGTAIRSGDVILAVASSGLHISHYTQMRVLLDKMPWLEAEMVDGETFIQHIMKPQPAYYKALRPLLGRAELHGIAHLTVRALVGGHLQALLPDGLAAEIDLKKLRPLPFFSFLKRVSGYDEEEMVNHQNCGVGLFLIVDKDSAEEITKEISQHFDCYELGRIKQGREKIVLKNHVKWE